MVKCWFLNHCLTTQSYNYYKQSVTLRHVSPACNQYSVMLAVICLNRWADLSM